MTYLFEEGKHIHTLDGKPLIGVTTCLSVISKPALIQWAANMAVDYLKGVDPDYITDKHFEEARKAHTKKKEKAGDWGTKVHKAIEEWIKEKKEEPDLDEKGMQAFNNFRAWAEENSVEFLESEKHIYSKELWIGGICDLVVKINGKKYLSDIKTSSGIYKEHFFQMAAYDLCFEEMGEKDIEGYVVVNLKKDGNIEVKMAYDRDINKRAFKAALELYKIINQLK